MLMFLVVVIIHNGISEDMAMAPNISKYQPFKASTLVTSFFKVLSLPGLVILYVTYYSDITVFFTGVLPTAFGDFFDKIDAAIDARGINLTTLLLSFLVLIPRIILGLIVFALWMVIGELNKLYVLPVILAGLVLGIDRSRKAIIREFAMVFTVRFFLRSLVSLAVKLLITKVFPVVSEKAKILRDFFSDLVGMLVEKVFSFIYKRVSDRLKRLLNR